MDKENEMQVAAKPKSQAERFRDQMDKQRDLIVKQMPKGIDADRFIRTAITTVNMNPALLQCTPVSLYASFMQAAKDGLLPDGKEAVVQPYNCKITERGQPDRWEQRAQYMPMVKGIINGMYRTGSVSMVDAVAVYEKDHFQYHRGDNPRIEHEPYMGMEDPGLVIAAYAVIKLCNGEIKREVMTRRDIEKVRDASKAAKGPGWNNWYDQFAIKAVIKRASKQLPTDSEALSTVIEHDNEAMGFDFSEKPVVQSAPVQRISGQPSRLHGIMGLNKAEQEQPVEFANSGEPENEGYYTGE